MKRFINNAAIIALLIISAACFTAIFVLGTSLPLWLGLIVVAALGGASFGCYRLAEKIYRARPATGKISQN